MYDSFGDIKDLMFESCVLSKETCFYLHSKFVGNKCLAYLSKAVQTWFLSFSKIHVISLGLGSCGNKYLHVLKVTLVLTYV